MGVGAGVGVGVGFGRITGIEIGATLGLTLGVGVGVGSVGFRSEIAWHPTATAAIGTSSGEKEAAPTHSVLRV